MHTVILGLNTLDPSSWTKHEVPKLIDFLEATFGEHFPEGARIFHFPEGVLANVSELDDAHDVTPIKGKIETLQQLIALDGYNNTFYVLLYPTSPANFAISFALLMLSVGIGFLFPKDKKDPGRPPRQGSSNNTLGDRQNGSRLLGRVPDIYGKVRATPDLVQLPWIFYDNHQQQEVCLMCIGRGSYEVAAFDVFEGDMRVQTIPEMSVEVYAPGELPAIGIPQMSIGAPVGFPAYNVYQVEGVAGQIVFARNAFTVHGAIPFPEADPEVDNKFGVLYRFMQFGYNGGNDGRIYVPLHGADVSEVTIAVGDVIELRMERDRLTRKDSARPKTDGMVDQSGFSGVPVNVSDNNLGYPVLAINHVVLTFQDFAEILLDVPVPLQVSWANLATYANGHNIYCPSVLATPLRSTATTYKNTIGPFFVDDPLMTSINCNFVAERGLYVDDTKNTQQVNVNIVVSVTPADASGLPSGAQEDYVFTLVGSRTDLTTRALTAAVTPTFSGRCLVQAIRADLTNWRVDDPGQSILAVAGGTLYPASDWTPIKYKAITGIVQDEVKWTQCYSFSDPAVSAFGNTTLVSTRVVASKATNIIKDRKLSMIVTRKLSHWDGANFVGPLAATELGENIFFGILKDSELGNIANNQIDFPGIAAAFGAVRDYFGDDITKFAHTFDSEDSTLEDMLSAVAESCFCTAYREGQIIKVKTNIANNNASILFNHRNIIPESQTINVSFGTEADYDGVKVDYFNDASNTIDSLTVPTESAAKPRELTMLGLRDAVRAGIHAWRAYNTIIYQNTGVEFEATSEAALALNNDKVLVADVNAAKRQDGEITSVAGVVVTTSQPVDITGGVYTIFLQHTDGTVQAIGIASSPNARTLVLSSAPAGLVVDASAGVRTTYAVVNNADRRTIAYLIDTKSAQGKLTWRVTAHNYSHGYYFVDGLQLWIAPKLNTAFGDVSPYKRLTVNSGGVLSSNITRGAIYDSSAGDFLSATEATGTDALNGYFSYTKAFWVFKNATGDFADFLWWTGAGSAEEEILISTTDVVRVFHHGVAYVTMAAFPIAAWHHIAATYNFATGDMILYFDGEKVASATGVPAPGTRTGFRAVSNLNGLTDDLRLYQRAMSADEVRELYQKTLL